jgi:ABC-type branched-subunit amino acid transport system substrate-binding protein
MKRLAWIAVTALGGLLAGSVAACRDGEHPVDNRAGVTNEPCPKAIDRSKGCIYLGIISDLSVGPRAAEAVAVTEAQQKFWDRVNRAGGIGGREIDAVTYVRDNRSDTTTHVRAYDEIRGKVLALAQTMDDGGTAAILSDLRTDSTVAVPASRTSAWSFEPVMLESGANYCVEGINAIDYARTSGSVRSVLVVHLPGEYGDDAAAGVKLATEANMLSFINIKTDPGGDNQDGAADAIVARQPDVVILQTTATETEPIVRKAVADGYRGRFVGAGPSWDNGLLRGPAADALRTAYVRMAPWAPWNAETPGHEAMRAALGSLAPQDGQVSGWIGSYPLKAAIEAAAARNDLTHTGVLAAAASLGDRSVVSGRNQAGVDYEGMLPAGSANQNMVLSPATGTGVADVPVVRDFFAGPTVGRVKLDHPCFQDL